MKYDRSIIRINSLPVFCLIRCTLKQLFFYTFENKFSPIFNGEIIKNYLSANIYQYLQEQQLMFHFIFSRPRSKGEYLFVIAQLLFGLLLFATVLGHVANIVTSVSAARKEFQGEREQQTQLQFPLPLFLFHWRKKNRRDRS